MNCSFFKLFCLRVSRVLSFQSPQYRKPTRHDLERRPSFHSRSTGSPPTIGWLIITMPKFEGHDVALRLDHGRFGEFGSCCNCHGTTRQPGKRGRFNMIWPRRNGYFFFLVGSWWCLHDVSYWEIDFCVPYNFIILENDINFFLDEIMLSHFPKGPRKFVESKEPRKLRHPIISVCCLLFSHVPICKAAASRLLLEDIFLFRFSQLILEIQ